MGHHANLLLYERTFAYDRFGRVKLKALGFSSSDTSYLRCRKGFSLLKGQEGVFYFVLSLGGEDKVIGAYAVFVKELTLVAHIGDF